MTYEDFVNMMHGAHNSISPGANAGTLMSLLGRGGLGAMRAGTGASQGDILNDPGTAARIGAYNSGPARPAPVGTKNYHQAEADLRLTPEELSLYERHLTNLNGPGGTDNPDGSRSTLYQSVQEHSGKFYNVPTVWNGKRETEKYTRPDGTTMDVPNATALANIDKAGWRNFPAYNTPDEADARYEKMHQYMEKDTAEHMANKGAYAPPPSPAPAQVPALGGLGLFPAAPMGTKSPLQTAVATPSPLPGNTPPQPPALSAQAQIPPAAPQGVPMPTARPPDAPVATPDMGFFARNAAMMRDPSSGAFLDPANADRAQASGPDVINKLMSYFHKKDNPSDT